VASLVFDAGRLGHEAGGLPFLLALPAPMLSRRPSLGGDARLRASALAVGMELFLLSLSYISP
jgi:hypothetical protein